MDHHKKTPKKLFHRHIYILETSITTRCIQLTFDGQKKNLTPFFWGGNVQYIHLHGYTERLFL